MMPTRLDLFAVLFVACSLFIAIKVYIKWLNDDQESEHDVAASMLKMTVIICIISTVVSVVIARITMAKEIIVPILTLNGGVFAGFVILAPYLLNNIYFRKQLDSSKTQEDDGNDSVLVFMYTVCMLFSVLVMFTFTK